MPIIALPGPEAIQIRKQNEYSAWGNRNEDNRVEPVAKPAFEVPIRFRKKERIFTIGSCFARNVENALIARGFRIPMRELFKSKHFKDLPPGIINNFGTPSIYNELAWAFGERHFDEHANIVEFGPGKFIDLHMVNSIRPAPYATVIERRRGLADAMRTLSKCRVLIMTLGLVELWWDQETQCYLNTAPLPSLVRRWPKRFVLHVLDFDECYHYLRNALDVAFAHTHRKLSVILTVSPVPMMETHRNIDVITANSYSKSLLRSVAEHIVSEDSRVSYFPSFETVSLSDRTLSWSDDFVHVNEQMVSLNVDRMVDAFTGKNPSTASILADLGIAQGESAEALFLAEEARTARLSNNGDFFDQNRQSAETSPAFALEFARYLFDQQRYDELLALSQNDERAEMITLRAEVLVSTADPIAAIEAVRPICLQGIIGSRHWKIYVAAAKALGSKDRLLSAEQEWRECHPRSAPIIDATIGRALRSIGEDELALERLARAATRPDSNDATAIEYGFALMRLNRPVDARKAIEGIHGNTDWQAKQIARLRSSIEASLG